MSKLLFINGNLHGHVNPTLPVVRELVRRGEEVFYFSTREFQSKIEAAGAVFMDYGEDFDQFLKQFSPHGSHPFYTLMEYMLAFDRTIMPIVLKRTAGMHFDCLLHDIMFGGGNLLARQLELPAIASCSSFVMEKPPLPAHMLEPGFHPQLDILYEELKKVREEWNLEKLALSDIFFKREALILVYTSRLFQPQGDTLGAFYCFTGPSIMDRNETADFRLLPERGKLIYISMGTINNHCDDFYNNCLEAFADSPYQVVMSVGKSTAVASLKHIPDNFIVRNYIPQLEALKHAEVFISHGGLNSVSEALYYGVPVIAVPMANDQPAVAARLEELGAGLKLKYEDITPGLLKNAVQTVLAEPDYRIHSHEIRESFLEAGGYKRAADEIISYIRRKVPADA